MKRSALLLLAALSASGAEPPRPEDLVPEDALLCLSVDSVADLRKALAASPVYTGVLDGSWEANGQGFLRTTGVDPRPARTVLFDLLAALEPLVEGPAVAALTKDGPLILLKDRDGSALKEARARGLRAEADGGFLRLTRRPLPPLVRPISASPRYLKARAAAPGPVFLYADPGALARSGLLGRRLQSIASSPCAEALAWSCAFGPDGVSDTLRLLRPGRKPLFPPAAPLRLASALPAQSAAAVSGRVSLPRLRQALLCLLGRDWIGQQALLAEAAGWEGEVAASFGWALVFPDVLVGFESADPKAAAARILKEAQARGATVKDGLVGLPDQVLPWTVKAGDRAVWIGSNPASVDAALKAVPKEGKPRGLAAVLKLPEAFGPAAAILARFQQPGGPPIGKLLSAKARFNLTVDEDAEGLVLKAQSPCGLLPALSAAGLGLQALGAHKVVEPPLAVIGPVRRGLPAVRGLEFLEPVEMKVVTEAETHDLFAKEFAKELPPEKMAKMEDTMRAFGLLEPGQDLGKLLNGALVDLVGGFYDPEVKKLFLIEGLPGQRIVAAHELTHALQDQHFHIGDMQKAMEKGPADADRQAALLALIEGDASVAMLEAFQAQAAGNPAAGRRMLLEILASPELALGQLDAMQEMPDSLLYQTMFSYEEGAEFVRTVREAKGWKGVDAMFSDPPTSTEQVLHPEKYWGAKRDLPQKVEAPKAPDGWAAVNEDTMGELGIRAYLRHWIGAEEADRAAEGWGGDRFALFSKGKERLLLWKTVWDSEKEAAEFAASLSKAQGARYGKACGRTKVSLQGIAVEFRDGPP